MSGDRKPEINPQPTQELLHKLGYDMLAAMKLSLDNEASRRQQDYNDIAPDDALAEAVKFDERLLTIFHDRLSWDF